MKNNHIFEICMKNYTNERICKSLLQEIKKKLFRGVSPLNEHMNILPAFLKWGVRCPLIAKCVSLHVKWSL